MKDVELKYLQSNNRSIVTRGEIYLIQQEIPDDFIQLKWV